MTTYLVYTVRDAKERATAILPSRLVSSYTPTTTVTTFAAAVATNSLKEDVIDVLPKLMPDYVGGDSEEEEEHDVSFTPIHKSSRAMWPMFDSTVAAPYHTHVA